MNKDKLKFLFEKVPFAAMQLITLLYLALIGLYLPASNFQQLAIKLLVMVLGLFVFWRMYEWQKEISKQKAEGMNNFIA